ncbi:MAG: lysophospholipid acyltransferase family protein [Geminicoccaceae bacterium]
MFLTRTKIRPQKEGRALRDQSVLAMAKLRAEALALRCFWRLSLMLGPERASNLAARMMGWMVRPGSESLRRLRHNLKTALRDESETDIDQITREAASNLARVIAEYPHLRRIAGPELPDFIDFVADEPGAELTPERPPALYIGVHQANWEILSSLGAPLGKPMTIVVSPLSNPFVHHLVSKARPEAWVEQAERDQATRSLVRCLQSGRSVGLLADQRYEGGNLVPFFGRDAMTAIGPAKLAIKFGCDLVPTRVERIGPVRFRITTFAAIRPDETIDDAQEQAIDMMSRVNRHFEAWIREKPGEWMCMKRRWPKPVYGNLNGPTSLSSERPVIAGSKAVTG